MGGGTIFKALTKDDMHGILKLSCLIRYSYRDLRILSNQILFYLKTYIKQSKIFVSSVIYYFRD